VNTPDHHSQLDKPEKWSRRLLLGAAAASLISPLRADDADVYEAILTDFNAPVENIGQIEINMPAFSDSGASVPMEIFVPSPMSAANYPQAVRVYAPRNPRPRLISLFFSPACGEARMSTRVRLGSFQDIVAVAELSGGNKFRATRHVDVTYGACEDLVANDQFPPGWKPRMRVAVPNKVAKNTIFTVRTIINHPMETGLRHDKSGLRVPVRIAESFSCSADGKTLFRAKLEPAVAANPYIAFSLKLERTAELQFQWVNTTGEIYTQSAGVEII